jgi:hypothetical protein
VSAVPNYTPSDVASDALRDHLLILSLIKDIRTAIPVKVVAVHPGTGTPPTIGTVDVQPLVQTVDGSGKLWALGVTYGAPFCRVEAGNTAIVVDPAIGDIGLAVVCDRDISSVIASSGLSGPGSARTHDISDLVYLFSIRSPQAITQYILANGSGIKVLSPNTITLQGAQINLVGPVTQTNGDVTMQTKLTVPNVDATTDVMVPNGSVNGHVHLYAPGGGTPIDTGPMTL